jgi:Tol biopolymer transport system component
MKMQLRSYWKFGFVVASAIPALAQETIRVSVSSSGEEANYSSGSSSVSGDGRRVAFLSWASNLVPGDSNGEGDIFLHDRLDQTTIRVSVDSSGTEANQESGYASVSDDGQLVAFASLATNLVPGDTTAGWDVFVHDCVSGVTSRVSVSSSGEEADGDAAFSKISGNGRFVLFSSVATNLVAGDTNLESDEFVHDRESGQTVRVSVDSAGGEGNGASRFGSISADGRFIAFTSVASNLVANDTNGVGDVFVHDRLTGQTERVSLSSLGAQGNNHCGLASISADGRWVAFETEATNLVAEDENGTLDILVRDRAAGLTTRASVDSQGVQANLHSLDPQISGSGRFVAFTSWATNLIGADKNQVEDVFLHDLKTGRTSRVSVAAYAPDPYYRSDSPSIDFNGSFVSFGSLAHNIVTGDTNGDYDVFLHEACRFVGEQYCISTPNITGSPAVLCACGSVSAGSGELHLTARPVPNNQMGLFFHGANQVQLPFGNGYLCAGGDIVRGALTQSTDNLASYEYDNSDVRHSLQGYVGSTRNFQYWFRDQFSWGSMFNTSDAISIEIVP